MRINWLHFLVCVRVSHVMCVCLCICMCCQGGCVSDVNFYYCYDYIYNYYYHPNNISDQTWHETIAKRFHFHCGSKNQLGWPIIQTRYLTVGLPLSHIHTHAGSLVKAGLGMGVHEPTNQQNKEVCLRVDQSEQVASGCGPTPLDQPQHTWNTAINHHVY